jgi:hypothetical protein
MFLSNKYTTWYYKLIDDAENSPRDGYTENHHIIPTSLGGVDDKKNKVRLTAREHFVAHKLLVKMTQGKNKSKMSYAYLNFFMKSKYHLARTDLRFTSREYEKRKKVLAESASKLHKGKTVSRETIEKMLASRRRNNKPYPDSARQLHREVTKERWTTDYEKMVAPLRRQSTRDKISKANKGKNRHSEEGCQQISARNNGAGNGRAKHIVITSPNETIYHCHGNFQAFCKEHNLPYSSMCHLLHKTKSFKAGATVGWKADFA